VPVSPSKLIQQFVTKNGGNANATTASARKRIPPPRLERRQPQRHDQASAYGQRRCRSATSRLFWSKGQFN